MSRKFLIAISVIFSVMVGLWIWTLAIPKNVINIGGSASVDPILQRVTSKYASKTQKKFVYSSTGSASGISNLKSKVYEIGFVSKAVLPDDFDGNLSEVNHDVFADETTFKNYFDESANQGKYHYVTFAKDAFVFIYNIRGTNFEPFEDYFTLQIDQEGKVQDNRLLKSIYEHDDQADLLNWHQLAAELIQDNDLTGPEWQQRLAKVSNIDVTPYASTPGSGTRSSFETLTGVKPGQAVNQYGNNGSFFAQISASDGAFGFVNLAFAQEIFKSQFKQLKTVVVWKDNEKWNIGKNQGDPFTYPLTRPFNAIFYNDDPENNKKMTEVLDFIYWFATSADLSTDYEEEGLSQLMAHDFLVESFLNKKEKMREEVRWSN